MESLLKEKVSVILGHNYFDGIQEWYRGIITEQCDYVVFVGNRDYSVALIMEDITGLRMAGDGHTVFLTDSSIILFCDEFARQYIEKGTFPNILLCTVSIIHGRTINHLIESIQEMLFKLLPGYNYYDIERALVKSIQIKVYNWSDEISLILSRYEFRVNYAQRLEPANMHKLVSSINSLGVQVQNYIYSLNISDLSGLDLSGYIETSYQNTKQYTKVQYIGTNEKKKAIITLRIVWDNLSDGYKVIPFIFMPNLSEKETDILLNNITKQMENKGIKKEYISLLRHLNSIQGKRTFNELVTLWLSQAILHEFCICNRIGDIKPDENEIRKIESNFNCSVIPGFGGVQFYKDMIKTIVIKQVFSIGDIERIINNSIQDGRKLLNIKAGGSVCITEKERVRIKEKIEDYFYDIAVQEERRAYTIGNVPYFHTDERSNRNVRGCGFALNDINKGYTEIEAVYSIAYFLQMYNAGVIEVSSYAYNKTNVVGFSQFIKAGEQSLLLMPLRMYEWLPLIKEIQVNSNWHGYDFSTEVNGYINSNECDLKPGLGEAIIKFIDTLSNIGQKAEEWIGNYIDKIELGDFNGIALRRERFKFMEKQITHQQHYISYRNI